MQPLQLIHSSCKVSECLVLLQVAQTLATVAGRLRYDDEPVRPPIVMGIVDGTDIALGCRTIGSGTNDMAPGKDRRRGLAAVTSAVGGEGIWEAVGFPAFLAEGFKVAAEAFLGAAAFLVFLVSPLGLRGPLGLPFGHPR